MPKKATLQDFIEKSKAVHGENANDYSQCNYVNNATPVTLLCGLGHGEYKVMPQNHTAKKVGCPYCAGRVTTTAHFIMKSREVHGDKYNYDKVVFTGAKDYVTIICPDHQEFSQRADNHYSAGNGCPICANNQKMTQTEFIKRAIKAHNINGIPIYDYSRSVYVNSDTKLEVICRTHKPFWVSPDNHINKLSGCALCHNKTEGILYETLIPLYPSLIHNYSVDWCRRERPLPFDFVIPDYNIIIELDGPQHFEQRSNWGPFEETQQTDKYKMQCANQNEYSVIRLLQEDVYYKKINWIEAIQQAIQTIQANRPNNKNIYICSNNEYIVYLQDTISLSSAAPSAINDIDPDMHQIMNVPNL